MKTSALILLTIICVALTTAHAARGPSAHGMQKRLAACATCHGKRGQGGRASDAGIYPRLAGQPAKYLYRQMLDFKSRRRIGIPPATAMQRVLASIPPAYLRRIAAYYHHNTPPYRSPVSTPSSQRRRGRQLVRQGLPQQGIASCTGCHGPHLQGHPPDVPALAGQYARYLQIQFAHWAQGARHNTRHAHIAHALSTAQVQAVAAYLASLRPATANQPSRRHRAGSASARGQR